MAISTMTPRNILIAMLISAGGAAAADPIAHWAFQPIVRPAVPNVNRPNWPCNPIDRFVLAALDRSRLSPADQADRAVLIRRLKFDLLGLPPTPNEVAAFAADGSPDAYERLVERYLASPHYGERWARHWLDVIRFAESHGFEMNQVRRNAWPYRDYVIRALNDDKPYDRFLREQLAGDLLGADEATGFLVAGPWDQVKSPDVALTLQQRADELHDLVSVTGSAFLGLTVGCARCHDHKFDPVPQADYYAVKAIFAGVQHGERPLASAPGLDERRRAAELARQELSAVEARLRELEPPAKPGSTLPQRDAVNARRNIERFGPIEARFVRFTILKTNNVEPCIDELEVFATDGRNIALSSLGVKAVSSGDYPNAAIHKLEHINEGKYGNSHSWISNQQGKGWVQLEFPRPVWIDRIEWGRDREGKFTDRLAVEYRIEAAREPGKWQIVATSEDRIPFGKTGTIPLDPQRIALVAKRDALQKRLNELTQAPAIYAGRFSNPEPVHRLHRGDPMQQREPIGPGSLSAFEMRLQLEEKTPEAKRRLALAEWICDPKNPLTARVIVNRLWHYHFGQGLVSTPSDFGRNGARPSHPELLDWLASELIQSGWSLKHIHRLMLTASVYRQRSGIADSKHQNPQLVDRDNRLLWRMNRRRLEAEALRDAILTVSGKLDTRMGGPGFDLFEPNANYVKVYNPKQDFGPAEFRRLIYQSKPRMQLDDTFGSFDCPDAGQVAPKRNASTTPLQALNLLNSRFIVQQAGFFAERVRREAGSDSTAQVRRAFGLAFQREPAGNEVEAAIGLVREHGLAALCRALLNANEFVYVE